MKRINDQNIRDAFREDEENPIGEDFGKEDLWLRIDQQLPKSRKLHPNWYRSAAAILVLVVLSGWSITLVKYNQIQTVNKKLTASLAEMERMLESQKKQSDECLILRGKVESKIADNVGQLPERKTKDYRLMSENTKLKAERESLISANASLIKKLNVLSRENFLWADSMRFVTGKISILKDLPRAKIETPRETVRPKETKTDQVYSQNVKTEVYMSSLQDKRRGRRLRIQIFNPGEPVENLPANNLGIFKLFK